MTHDMCGINADRDHALSGLEAGIFGLKHRAVAQCLRISPFQGFIRCYRLVTEGCRPVFKNIVLSGLYTVLSFSYTGLSLCV